MDLPPPLMLSMENTSGQEVSMQIDPGDDFRTFLVKAKALLGYDIDINSVTHNQPVSLNDNIYQFLLNTDLTTDPSKNEDLYILDDGTQIRASQIHFDNEDPHVDLTAEKIPFVQFSNFDNDSDEIDESEVKNMTYNIVKSPVRDPKDTHLMIPFKLVRNNTSGFEDQFTKYLEANCKTYATLNTVTNINKSPRSLIRDNFKSLNENYKGYNNELTHYTREEILNMFKDSPVAALPYETPRFAEKRRKRKSDPSTNVYKNRKQMSYTNGVLIAESESENCFICNKFVNNNKLYLFDNEDQKLHRVSPQKKQSTQLKIICKECLEQNFKPCRMKSPNQSLNPDEFLVIQNNQQYIFQKTRDFTLQTPDPANFYNFDKVDNTDFVKVEIGSDGDIVTNPVEDNDLNLVKNEKDSSEKDVEIVGNVPEIDDNIIDNLEDADDAVIEFLGKTQCDDDIKELKCRFCAQIFAHINEVIDHGDVHQHVMEDDSVFPCPLCDYGYANFKWLKGHLKTAHDKTIVKIEEKESDTNKTEDGTNGKETPNESSPIAKRTRSSMKNVNNEGSKETPTKIDETQNVAELETKFVIKTEVKQETLECSDEEIWIVHTAGDEADKQLKSLLDVAKNEKDDVMKKHKCDSCSRIFPSAESLTSHKCKTKKRKDDVFGTSKTNVKRSYSRFRNLDDSEEDLQVVEPRKKRTKEPNSDPQTVTCHNCNESFTSKVRLKFHMQFHDTTTLLTSSGEYKCNECEDTRFSTETELFDHVHFQHDKQRRWQCPVPHCGKIFYLRATLTKHSRSHTDTRRYVCGTCGKRFLDKQTLDEHGVTHLQIKPFQCHVCLKQLTRRSRLRMHLRAHEEELCPRLVLVCCVCEMAFRHEADVQEHLTRSPECIEELASEMKQEESMTMQLSPTSGLVMPTVRVVESPKLSKPIHREAFGPEAALLLSRVSDEARPLARVVRIEKAFRCEYCEDVFYSEIGLNNHRVIHKGVKNPFTCHICKVTFASYSRCTTHKTTHGFYKRSLADVKKQANNSANEAGPSSTRILGYGDFPVVKHFLCEDCGRSYLHWTYLQVHRRMKHATDHYTIKCPHCDMEFPNSWSLSYHKKKLHGNTKVQGQQNPVTKTTRYNDYKIPCRDCEQVLPNKTALYKHRKKEHSDVCSKANKPSINGIYWCGYCSLRYNSRVALRAHALTHTQAVPMSVPVTSQQSLQQNQEITCEVCKKAFANLTELSAHIRASNCARTESHASVECVECGRSFRTLSLLREHARVHTGERPFPCDVCGVAFRRSSAMRNHRLIHSGIRSWACPRCPKRFRIRSDLRTHLRLKHPASLLVIEVAGLNISPETVMERLTANNISHDKVIEITKMTFPKGVTSLVPNSSRALELLSHVPRTQVACSRSKADRSFEIYGPPRRGRGIAKNPRKQKLLARDVKYQKNEEHSLIALNMNKMAYSGANLTSCFTSVPLSTMASMANFSNAFANVANMTNMANMSNMDNMRVVNPAIASMPSFTNMSTMANTPTAYANMGSMANLSTVWTNMSTMTNATTYADMANVSMHMLESMSTSANMPNSSTSLNSMANIGSNAMTNIADLTNMSNMATSSTMDNMSNIADMSNAVANMSVTNITAGINPENHQDLPELNVQLLLRDGVLGNGNQMAPLQLDDTILLE